MGGSRTEEDHNTKISRTIPPVKGYPPRRLHRPEEVKGYKILFHESSWRRGRTMRGAKTVGGSFLERHILPLHIECPATTLSAVLMEK